MQNHTYYYTIVPSRFGMRPGKTAYMSLQYNGAGGDPQNEPHLTYLGFNLVVAVIDGDDPYQSFTVRGGA